MGILSSKLGRRLVLSIGASSIGVAAVAASLANSTLHIAVGAALLSGLVALGLAYAIAVRPALELTQGLKAAEEGDFYARQAPRSSPDELGTLAGSIHSALTTITDLRVANVDTEREMEIVKDELELKEKLAEQKKEIEAQLKQLTFLYELSRELAGQLEVTKLLDRFSALVHEELEVPRFAVLVFDESRGRIRVEASRGFSSGRLDNGTALDISGSVSAEAIDRAAPIYIANVDKESRAVVYEGEEAKGGTLLVVPVIYQRRPIGVLHFASPHVNAFSEAQRSLFVVVANQAAIALWNAQSFGRAVALSLTDALTGVANRRAVWGRLEEEWASSKRYGHALSVLMIDVDHFKSYNDQHGHLQGDDALRRVSHLLQQNIRRSDIIGRYGGEEFIVVLPQADASQALEVANKLRRSVEQADFPGAYLQPLGRMTVSIGVCTSGPGLDTLEDLIRHADEGLMTAKNEGRNTVIALDAKAS